MPPQSSARSHTLPLLLASLIVAICVSGWQLAKAPEGWRQLPLFDYTAFWAAARLVKAGEDPYDPARLAVLQREADPNQVDTLVMWPAPWALTFLLPFTNVDAQLSHLHWLAFEFCLLLAGIYAAWRVYAGRPDDVWLAGLAAFTFLPTYCVLITGQMGPLMLLGLVGFLHFQQRGRAGLAGAVLALTAIKPQLFLLFWLVLLFWTMGNRRWTLPLGGALGIIATLVWPVWEDPQLLQHYWVAITQRTQTHSHFSPLLGTSLRLLFGVDKFWLQFAPLAPGLTWAIWYWLRHRHHWNWPERLPTLLFASLVVAPYGAWPFDLMVLLMPLLQQTVQLQSASRQKVYFATGYFALVNLLALIQMLAETEYFWFLWLTPALWAGYALVGALGRSKS